MSYKKNKSTFLTVKKVDFIINDLKESCTLCKKNTPHLCCISVIIDEWKILKNELSRKQNKKY